MGHHRQANKLHVGARHAHVGLPLASVKGLLVSSPPEPEGVWGVACLKSRSPLEQLPAERASPVAGTAGVCALSAAAMLTCMHYLALVLPAVAVGATAAPSATTCAVLGCTTHKADDGRSCQCNFHCSKHQDCCSDNSQVCANATDPCLVPGHSCKTHAAGNSTTSASKPEHAGKATNNNTTKATHVGKEASSTNSAKSGHDKASSEASKKTPSTASKTDSKQGSHHEHTPKADSSKGGGGGSGGSKADGKGDGSSTGKATAAAAASDSGGSSSGKATAPAAATTDGGKEHTKKEANAKDAKATEGGDKKAAHEHSSSSSHDGHAGGQHSSINWVIVILACLTGLFVPITVAIILVLRARGVCCAKHPHQRVDTQEKPADNAVTIEGEPNLGTGEPEDGLPVEGGLPIPMEPAKDAVE